MPNETTKYFPAYQIGSSWYRFSQRGQDVSFATEQEAQEYIKNVAGSTRVETETKPLETSQKGSLNGSSQGFRLMR